MEPKEANGEPSQRKFLTWITIVFSITLLLIAGLSYYLVFLYPENEVSQLGITNVTEKANFINQYRTTSIQLISTFAQILGGSAVLVGIYFAWNNLIVAQATLKSDQEKSQKNFELAQEGQITDRFTRAVDQLGSKELEIRFGGIYALERITNESERDYWPIMEILTAYVRKNSWNEHIRYNEDCKRKGGADRDPPTKVSLDIQAVLTVIGRRKCPFEEEIDHLDLRRTYLREVNLIDANLNRVNLLGADLEGAVFELANLAETDLGRANLIGARFTSADLDGTFLQGANLQGANFMFANLIIPNLEDTNLDGACFFKARIEGIKLSRANLKGANFQGANFSYHQFTSNDPKSIVLAKNYLVETNLEGADFEGANLIGIDLKGAKNLTVDQLSKVKTLYNVELDEELEMPLREKYPALFKKPIFKKPNQMDFILTQ